MIETNGTVVSALISTEPNSFELRAQVLIEWAIHQRIIYFIHSGYGLKSKVPHELPIESILAEYSSK